MLDTAFQPHSLTNTPFHTVAYSDQGRVKLRKEEYSKQACAYILERETETERERKRQRERDIRINFSVLFGHFCLMKFIDVWLDMTVIQHNVQQQGLSVCLQLKVDHSCNLGIVDVAIRLFDLKSIW